MRVWEVFCMQKGSANNIEGVYKGRIFNRREG